MRLEYAGESTRERRSVVKEEGRDAKDREKGVSCLVDLGAHSGVSDERADGEVVDSSAGD